ncbi:MAG: glycine C-acetyltransferase [Planctomycetaceae bacterium]|nr:glycine C-acetyltransferase [Planctomycetaceae bacterium]
MVDSFNHSIQSTLDEIRAAGLYKGERIIQSSQANRITVSKDQTVINLCANNYLGLSDHPEIIRAAHEGLDRWGFGMSSVRFICGTQQIHKTLEERLSSFLGMEDTILYPSCFDANGGLFETLLGPEDAVISDQLNHASIIDGVRLCKAKRYRYANSDMDDLRRQLQQAKADGTRYKLITTDGVFSMDGFIARLDEICELADEYQAMVHFDDCHATGFLGKTGRGTHEYRGVVDRVDLTTGTLGKAMGGASGGYTSGKSELIDLLRQRSRPYLFSNSIAPPIVAASLKVLDLITQSDELRNRLQQNTTRFRQGMTELGFELLPGEHPIVPVMLQDAKVASEMADRLLTHGVYVIGFSYPVVPKGQARIRTQLSAAHTLDDIDTAIAAFAAVKSEMNLS